MEAVSRRRALQLGAALVIGSTSLARSWLLAPAGAATVDRSAFEPHVGRTFKMVGAAGTAYLTLTAVDDLPHGRPGSPTEFAATFRYRSGGRDLPSGIYSFRNRRFGAASLFAVPVHRPGADPVFEVVTNSPA